MIIDAGYAADRVQAALQDGIEVYIPGRTESVSGPTGPRVYVDFGHSSDAFEKTLRAVKAVTPGRVIMLFGADGDRDPVKRPEMARVAAAGSDIVVITDHHPRFEDPASIRRMLVEAAREAFPGKQIVEVSPPEAAIDYAVDLARDGDAILWAGPGHQDYRDIRGVRTPYSARALAREALTRHGWPVSPSDPRAVSQAPESRGFRCSAHGSREWTGRAHALGPGGERRGARPAGRRGAPPRGRRAPAGRPGRRPGASRPHPGPCSRPTARGRARGWPPRPPRAR